MRDVPRWVFAGLAALVLLVIWVLMPEYDYMHGFWTASNDDFCQDAGISSMMLYIGDPIRSWGGSVTRNGYIVITDGISNQELTITYRLARWCGSGRRRYHCTIKFEDEQVMPEDVWMDTDIYAGTLRIYSGDTLYARLYKNHEVSAW